MDSRERTFLALEHAAGDRIPIDFWASAAVIGKIEGSLGLSYGEFLDRYDVDLRYIPGPRYTGPPLEGGRDIWGVERTAIEVQVAGGAESYREVVRSPLAAIERADEIERYSSMMAAKAALPEFRTDYRKKHGTLEEINKVVNQARKEREQRERMLFEETQTETVGPPDTHDIDYDPFAKDKAPLEGDDAPVRILYQDGEASTPASPPAPAPEVPASGGGGDAGAEGEE